MSPLLAQTYEGRTSRTKTTPRAARLAKLLRPAAAGADSNRVRSPGAGQKKSISPLPEHDLRGG